MTKFPACPPLDGLVDLACRDGVDVRPTLLRVLTDLYVQKPVHSADEETQYVELALGLVDTVDAATRAAVAASLSGYPAAPAPILAKLAGTPLQPEPETNDLTELFFAAGSEERRLILVNLDAAAATSARLPPVSNEVIRRLENAALQRNIGEFSRILERALGIDRAMAERVARDSSGEPTVVAAKALGMKAAVLQRVLLILNPAIGQSVARVYELADLYDEITREAAERMLAIWRKGATAARQGQRPAYEPVHHDDEGSSARSLAAPSEHRVTRPQQRPSERFKSNGR